MLKCRFHKTEVGIVNVRLKIGCLEHFNLVSASADLILRGKIRLGAVGAGSGQSVGKGRKLSCPSFAAHARMLI